MRAVTTLLSSALLGTSLVVMSACAPHHEEVRSNYLGTSAMDQAQVTQLLNRSGYHDVTNLHKNGPDWVGSATHDGSPVNFDIDKDGNIHTQ